MGDYEKGLWLGVLIGASLVLMGIGVGPLLL